MLGSWLGSAWLHFVTLYDRFFFARNLLGSWLGSTWIQFHTSTKTEVLHSKGAKKCLVPGLDPLGSTLLHVTRNVFFAMNLLGS